MAWVLSIAMAITSALAATFTSDTSIGALNTVYDGADIIVTNCVLTIDGPHSFNSLRIRNGGVVTHTQVSNGIIDLSQTILGELHVLSSSNSTALDYSYAVVGSIVVYDAVGTNTYVADVDYVVDTSQAPVTSIILTTNSAIVEGAQVLVDYSTSRTVPSGLSLSIVGDATIEPGGAINVKAKGYSAPFGPGSGSSQGLPESGSGGGHGGYGGVGASNSVAGATYDSIVIPSMIGSGGGAGYTGSGGMGGGAVKLSIGGALQIDGSISADGANGTNSRSGGGAGGGIWLSAQTVSGTGSILADGGAGEPTRGGGGGGGRIALYANTNSFSGPIFARGGIGFVTGGAGTIYQSTNNAPGVILVDNDGRVGTNTSYAIFQTADVRVRGQARLAVAASSVSMRDLIVESNGFVVRTPSNVRSVFNVTGRLRIDAGGAIIFDGTGITSLGAGATTNAGVSIGNVGGGGGFGGSGGPGAIGPAGGAAFGNLISPIDGGGRGGSGGSLGSSVPNGGLGGGAMLLTVSGDLVVNGSISANGLMPFTINAGGGAGGSISVSANSLSGTGTITANGGNGNGLGGGGGGGRIALAYLTTSTFSGTITAYGGGGGSFGGAGTIYRTRNQSPEIVLVDNGGHVGATSTLGLSVSFPSTDLIVTGGGSLTSSLDTGSFSVRNLVVGSNSAFIFGSAFQANITVASNLVVEAGGWINGDGSGLPFAGTGSGGTITTQPFGTTGGGGGHGGWGTPGLGGAPAGIAFDSVTTPALRGGSGGSITAFGSPNAGGPGGSALRLNLPNGTLRIDGKVSVNGHDAYSQNGGGGAGGSIYIITRTLIGSGLISANGGAGLGFGGSGGGGRISFSLTTNNFVGAVMARGGGSGTNFGGAGTIYTSPNPAFPPFGGVVGNQLIVDNGGPLGALTLVTPPLNTAEVIIDHGARCPSFNESTLRNLYIGSNSWLIVSNTVAWTITSNVVVAAGGRIYADGMMAGLGLGGNGGTLLSSGGGGGHGGYGGQSATGASGGSWYDQVTEPSSAGSPGGNNGGAGGGAMRLTVSRNFVLNGLISANGSMSTNVNSGGGSGGSVRISAQSFTGSGQITADGGAATGNGGGGAGGRIAISSTSNLFTGALSAFGGSGFVWGGAGSIWLNPPKPIVGGFPPLPTPANQLILNNGGHLGAQSPIVGTSPFDVTIADGAIGIWTVQTTAPVNNLLITSNAFLVVSNSYGPSTITFNTIVQAGGGILADGLGVSGPGFGTYLSGAGSGGGHGGMGGASSTGVPGGASYDNPFQPTLSGSYGGGAGTVGFGGLGGGVITLTTSNLVVDGAISANGTGTTNLNAGGGAGGTIRVTTTWLSGAGRISTDGGAGNGGGGGGGGGGMISLTFFTNRFAGVASARGGPGFIKGGAGTVYLKTNNLSVGQLIVDNGGSPGGLTSVQISTLSDLLVKDGATFAVGPAAPSLRNLVVTNAAMWVTNFNQGSMNNVTIATGGSLTANGTGSPGGTGQGAGRTFTDNFGTTGGGGGHGGYGGNGGPNASGGVTYDSATSPSIVGSGGGGGGRQGTNTLGGAGGGLINLNLLGDMIVDGDLTANGQFGLGVNSGGGSGGGIRVTAGRILGSGRITANGGAANAAGGGGGGGRIALSVITNNFNGLISAIGGSGSNYGGAGTICFMPRNSTNITQFIVDNGGSVGAYTTIGNAQSSFADLWVQAGARLLLPIYTIRNASVGSNSWLVVTNSGAIYSFSGDVTVQAGGGIIADGIGPSANQGNGPGGILSSSVFGYTGGGGGHAGFGAPSFAGAVGGNAYGSITGPTTAGSDGGGSQITIGGQGGRALRLNVTGTLRSDGRISADGRAGVSGSGGGGAGGSLWLTAKTLSGSGSISANGGAGNGFGGGGAGGRIALYYQTNNFTGPIDAHGGICMMGAGGAGTIYFKPNNQTQGNVVVDNDGLPGASTPLNSGNFNLSVGGGALVYPSFQGMVLSNLWINNGGMFASAPGATNLELIVLSNLVVATGASINVSGAGFTQANGPGAGLGTNGYGSGGGYGGDGGFSATAPGGLAYGSPTQPVDMGSGGGFGSGPAYGFGSYGGGAIRLSVGSTLTVDGSISADGFDGLQDGSGGGSGGSIWLSAGVVRGNGSITANGGEGELYGGGGGGGGRIAVYYVTNPGHTNNFIGEMTAFGGEGEYWGQDGSVFFSAGVPRLQVISYSPSGVTNNEVDNIDVEFDGYVNTGTVSLSDMNLIGPNGPLPVYSISSLSNSKLRFYVAPQVVQGDYNFTLGPQIEDLYGRPMPQALNGSFTILLPTVEGTVRDGMGQPISGVLLQSNNQQLNSTTDANGHYKIGFLPNSNVTIGPVVTNGIAAPAFRTYYGLNYGLQNEDYVIVTSTGTMSVSSDGTNLLASWQGFQGLSYQLYYSTDMSNWLPYNEPIAGTNGVMQVSIPIDDSPAKFFRLGAN